MDMNVSSTIQHLKGEISNQLSAKVSFSSKVSMFYGKDDITDLSDRTQLADLGIGSESTIYVNTITNVCTVSISLDPHNNEYIYLHNNEYGSHTNATSFCSLWNEIVGQHVSKHVATS